MLRGERKEQEKGGSETQGGETDVHELATGLAYDAEVGTGGEWIEGVKERREWSLDGMEERGWRGVTQ